MTGPPIAHVSVGLNEGAWKFLAAVLDLLAAIEATDKVLVTDEIRSLASSLRGIVESGDF